MLQTLPPKARPDFSALGLLLPYLRAYRRQVIAAWAAMLIAAALMLGIGQGLRRLIDNGFVAGGADNLDLAALILFATVVSFGAVTALRNFLVSWLGERVAADLRLDAFARAIALAPDYFETARTGDLLTKLSGDIATLQSLVGSAVSQYLRSAVVMLGALGMLLYTSPKLTLIVLLVVPFVVVPLVLFGRRERKMAREAQERVADLGAIAEEAIGGLRTLQAFTHETATLRDYKDAAERSVATSLRRIRLRATLILLVICLGFGAITFALWVGGRDVLAGRITSGDLSAFVFYAVLLASTGATMSELWGEVQRAAGAAGRVAELLAEVPSIRAPATPAQFPFPRGKVTFEHVHFHYPAKPDQPSLHDFSLDIPAGKTVALVGPSGAGKTTIFQLLLRFYDPQSGVVRIDSRDIATLDPRDLRSCLGLVPQDPVIFSLSARENIRYGRPDATDEEVLLAARAANAGFLEELSEGLDTFLGEKGVRLSGGQRQRVAIARAILRDPAVLLLDEATSALDAESERAVQSALARLSQGRTTLVVAHRLATVRSADLIVVLDQGRVVETGTHDELIMKRGLYARLATLQFAE
jgi:ATP-binding cassette, subfamily B, bacterial